MHFLHRNIRTDAYLLDEDTIKIKGYFEDDRHKFECEISFSILEEKVIKTNSLYWHYTPYSHCQDVSALFNKLIGLKVAPGSSKKITNIIGGSKGCVHLVELVVNIFKCFYQAKHRLEDKALDTEEERILRKTKMLKNECYGYKVHAERLGM